EGSAAKPVVHVRSPLRVHRLRFPKLREFAALPHRWDSAGARAGRRQAHQDSDLFENFSELPALSGHRRAHSNDPVRSLACPPTWLARELALGPSPFEGAEPSREHAKVPAGPARSSGRSPALPLLPESLARQVFDRPCRRPRMNEPSLER